MTANLFDIVIVGAGPAGSAAACWAARHGASVAVLDKARFPRNKLCGGLFTGRSQTYCHDIFGESYDLSLAITRDEIEFWYKLERLSKLTDVPPVHLTMRYDLDMFLFQKALDAGATDLTGSPVTQVTNQGVTLRDGHEVQGRIIIGADGVNSVVAKHLFGRSFDPTTIGFGLEIEAAVDEQTPDDQTLRIDFGLVELGYGWSFPKQASTTIGVGGVRALNPGMKTNLMRYLDHLGLDTSPKRFKGHHLPFGDFRKSPGRGNVLLTGDAAGLIDPITGEGIALAMKSGQHAAQAALQALSGNAPGKAFGYYKSNLADMHRNLRIARRLRHVIFSRRFQPLFAGAFRSSGTVRMQYMRLLAGELEYPQLATTVLRRLPRYAWNALRR